MIQKIFFTVLFLLSNSFAVHPVPIEHSVQEIISYAKAYRKDTSLPEDVEETRQKNILEYIFTHLKKYDAHSCLDGAVRGFLEDEIPLIKDGYSLTNAAMTNLGGKSPDPVFLIKENDDALCYVVKAFKHPRDLLSKFVPEISALDLIQELSISGVVPIMPIAVAAYSNQVEEWGLLLETAARGHRIDQFIYRLGNLTPASKERKAFLKICQKVFQKSGEAFAELHSRKSFHPYSIPERQLSKYQESICAIMGSPFIYGELEKRVCMEEFLRHIGDIRESALNTPLYYSYWHGDAHLGNMFYDTLKDEFYFIDVAKMHYSVSLNEEPLFDGLVDLVQFEENLRRVAIDLLDDDELEVLLTAFYNAYRQKSVQDINQSIFLFNRTNKKLERLAIYARYTEEQDPVKKSTEQAIFYGAIEYFAKQLP